MKLFNSLDEIYSGSIRLTDKGYECPVCGGLYKTAGGAERHYTKQSCHGYKNIFQDTQAESVLLDIFDKLMQVYGRGRKYTVTSLRKSKQYNSIARFYLFCYNNRIPKPSDYLMYVLSVTKWHSPFNGLSYAQKESMLVEFRKAKRVVYDDSASETFWEANKDDILSDNNFLFRSLEKGEIHFEYLFNQIDFDGFADSLTPPEVERLETFLESVSGEEI